MSQHKRSQPQPPQPNPAALTEGDRHVNQRLAYRDRLRNAAPELYSACHAAIAYLDAAVPYGPDTPVFKQLCQAIAKADGATFERVGKEPDPRD